MPTSGIAMEVATIAAIAVTAVLLAGLAVTLAVLAVRGDDQAGRQACDVEVRRLLTTRDPLELQRAGILVRELRCDVARRWVPSADGTAS